ncbi:MAG: AbrB family transcriptional regulator, partial [Aldersonia sp.]|nr:AbrB family transcriptional regulator [Aldersonia sp.]
MSWLSSTHLHRPALRRWATLAFATAALWAVLGLIGAPSPALFASLVTAIALALANLGPSRFPRWAVAISQAALGAVIGSMIQPDTRRGLGSAWLPTVAIGLATLLISIVAGVLLGLHRDVDPLTGSLSLIAGGAT